MAGEELEEEEPDRWAQYRDVLARCAFVQRTFSRSPMLVALEPTKSGFVPWFPYTGQDYDPAQWRLVPGGWDHEHCNINPARKIIRLESVLALLHTQCTCAQSSWQLVPAISPASA
jgi:hypothetical protein